MTTLTYTVGRLLCGGFRDFLAAERVKGRALSWHEGSGWFQRTFTIAGPVEDLRYVDKVAREWVARMEREEATS
jgi:hypothetical protein